MEQDTLTRSSARRQTSKFKKGRVALLLTALLLLVTGVTYALLGGFSSATTLATTFFTKEKINILVLGVDAREDDVGRSDTTFVVTIDTAAKQITMLSVPRDSRIKIEGHGWDKMNHAYAFGGSKLSKSSVENLLGIPMDYTVVINFEGFVRMVDAIGGVTIDISKAMHYSDPYDDNGGLYIDLHPGVQKLNGKTAIEYVRYRDDEGDIGRVARQQKFLKALLHEFSNPQLITKLPNLIKEFASAVKTDMPTKEMVKLIPIINEAAKAGLHTEWISGTPWWIQDVSYWLPDIKELRYKVAQIQGITVDERYMQVTDRLVSEYANSVPRETRVAGSSPAVKRASPSDRPVTDSAKPITTNTVANSTTTKAKATSPAAGQASIDAKPAKITTPPATETAKDSASGAHKTTATP